MRTGKRLKGAIHKGKMEVSCASEQDQPCFVFLCDYLLWIFMSCKSPKLNTFHMLIFFEKALKFEKNVPHGFDVTK